MLLNSEDPYDRTLHMNKTGSQALCRLKKKFLNVSYKNLTYVIGIFCMELTIFFHIDGHQNLIVSKYKIVGKSRFCVSKYLSL